MNVDLGPLINLGGVGAVLAWFLLRAESRMEKIERAIDRLTRAHLVAVSADVHVAKPIRDEAQEILGELGEGKT